MIAKLSDNAKVTVSPLNGVYPFIPLDEVYNPTGRCWPGMFNFTSKSKAVLKLAGSDIGGAFQCAALNRLKLIYVDGAPVDINKTFNIIYDNGIILTLK